MGRARLIILIAAACPIVAALAVVPAYAQDCRLSGSIRTTNFDGTAVNQNFFYDKDDVYLHAGPSGAPPDGSYYFQVTNPSGSTLLSEQPLNERMFSIVDSGFLIPLAPFADTTNRGGVYKVWVTSVACYNANGGFEPGSSKMDVFKVGGEPECYAFITGAKFFDADADGYWDGTEEGIGGWEIELWKDGMPSDTTWTDAAGEYAFMIFETGTYCVREVIPSADWVQTAPPAPGTFEIVVGSLAGQTYADKDFGNALCVAISGAKFYDADGDGCWDATEDGLAGWDIELWKDGQLVDTATTDAQGEYEFVVCQTGTYQVSEVIPSADWTQTWPLAPGYYEIVIETLEGQTYCEVDFGNVRHDRIRGLKFYDADTDGCQGSMEPGIPGWRIELWRDGQLVDTATTDASGEYEFLVCQAGTYWVKEVMPMGNWVQTAPGTPGYYEIVVCTLSGQIYSGNDFGNVRYGCPGGGLTIGFWSNKNGQSLFSADDLALMVSLNLRNANGSAFDPANYSAFRTWLRSATATNMAYMLSAQLAAMELNVFNGKVQGASLVYAPGVPGANAAGFIAVNALMGAADTELAAHGYTVAGSPDRALQETLKTALDKANNDQTFVCPGPGEISYP